MIIDKNFSPMMEQVFAGRGFSIDEAEALTHSMIDGTLSDVRIAAVLTGFRFLPLSEEVIIRILKTIQENHKNKIKHTLPHVVDCSGTGGDKTSTLNILTISSLVTAGAGAHVARFTGVGISNKSGSSGDVLQMLNINPANSLDNAYDQLNKCHFSFLQLNTFYPTLKHLMDIRKTLGFKTIIDLVFPLANPVNLTGQFIGVYNKDSLPLMANCMKKLGRNRALIAYGEDGLDEISVCSATYLSKLENGKISHDVIKPSDFGFKTHKIKDLFGKDVEYNTKILIETLKNRAHSAVLDAVILNAAATLWCAELCDSLSEGIALAKETINSGKALKMLDKWKNNSN
ncbi:anthranilate phosphoribosyltransferase [Silvanigrella aquatica]|uniref:Anthranilate phosphoribosyltransferase n=1 Tax=Silvanigrella aquatica TaxID=1915309 RepID=A0A1L4D2G7_9BACT|nr:anthranilate phosphoribosyltransferase [Silvanigrella aquatica]APJ04399.1 anthranilate phosphoribosyltransferase [Silvanigrella aquatica]